MKTFLLLFDCFNTLVCTNTQNFLEDNSNDDNDYNKLDYYIKIFSSNVPLDNISFH